MNGNQRNRAWFMIETTSNGMNQVKGMLRDFDDTDENTVLVVRVDEVDDGCYNLVAPIDAAEGSSIDRIEMELADSPQVKSYRCLRVTRHEYSEENRPPHNAEGFITTEEFLADKDPHYERGSDKEGDFFLIKVRPGRQKGSPGFTPWG